MKNKFRRIVATILSVLMIGGVVAPVNAGAQVLPDEDAFSYAYADQLDLRALEGLIFGADDQALSAAQLVGAQQAWKTLADNAANQVPEKSNIEVGLLEGLKIDLGGIRLPLIGEGGLLEFVLPEAGVGALREYAHAPTPMEAHAAAGLVSDDGGLTLTNPGEGGNMNINLLSLLNLEETPISELIIQQAGLELGALSAVAKKPNESAPAVCAPELTRVEYENLPNDKLGVEHSIIDEKLKDSGSRAGESDGTFCSAYQVADAKVVIDSPLVKNLVNEQVRPLVADLSSILNGLLGTGGPLSALSIGLTIPPLLEVGTNISAVAVIDIDQILEDLISTLLKDDPFNPLVVIDLKTGLIEINLEQLHSGTPYGLNGLDPNTPLVNDSDIDLILNTITSLLTDSPASNSNGLMAALERVLKGEEINGIKQGGLYSTELTITAGVTTKTLLGSPELIGEITLISTLGALLNQNAVEVPTKAAQELNPYGSYVLTTTGTVSSVLGLLLGGLVKNILGGVGTIVDGLLIISPSLLDTLLASASDSVLSTVLGSLSPLLRDVLQPLANVIINRQKVDALPNGVLFTTTAVEVNVATLLQDASLISLPLATASVMAQNWEPINVILNVAKVGDGRDLHSDGYTYDLVCKVNDTTIFESINDKKITYPAQQVGNGFSFSTSPNSLALDGASQNGGLTTTVQLPTGALCEVTANPTLEDETFIGLRPTGDDRTRTPYTYFLDTDDSKLYVSDDFDATTKTTDWAPITDLADIDTATVSNKWKNHSLTFQIPTAATSHTVNIVHAYDIDTRDIVVNKTVEGPAPALPGTFEFDYSTDNGVTWIAGANTISAGESLRIPAIPLITGTPLAVTEVLIREKITDTSANGPTVTWALETPVTPLTNTRVGEYSVTQAFAAGIGITVTSETTDDLILNVTNSYPVVVDFEAMLPATGVTTLVWVLGLGLLIALAALALYVNSRRK